MFVLVVTIISATVTAGLMTQEQRGFRTYADAPKQARRAFKSSAVSTATRMSVGSVCPNSRAIRATIVSTL